MELINPSSYFFNPHAIPTLTVSTLIFAIGLFVFFQHKTSPSNVSFFVLCLCINLWLYGISIVYSCKNPEEALQWYRGAAFPGVDLISLMVYTFSVHWLGLYRRQKYFLYLGYVLAPVFYLLSLTTPLGMPYVQRYFWGYYPHYGPVGQIFLIFFYTYFLAAFYNFFSELMKERDPLRRKQIKLIAIGFLVSIVGSVDYLPKLFDVSLYPFGYLPVLTWILIVAYLIVRYRMMEIQTVIHKTIMWGFTSLVFALPLVIFSYVGKEWLISLKPVSFSLLILGVVIFFTLYARFVQPRIDHLFQRRQWDLARAFEKFTDELVHLRGLDELSRHIVETIRNVFYVQEISLLLAEEESGLEKNHPFLVWLEDQDVLVQREYLELDPKYSQIKDEARQYFEREGSELCVPLVLSKKLLGVIHIGKKANLKRFGAPEINFLSDLRKTAAIAISNSLRSIAMQENLRRWNVELEKKVEERTRELKETQAQLIQAEKLASIGTLAGGIAHEINNPLTAVLTNVQMLKLLGQVEDKESLSLIEEGGKRCQLIIQKLMRYARKTDEAEIREKVDLNKVIRSVCDFLSYQLKQEDIELELSLKEVGPIEAIPNELEQVFTNLILNSKDAIKAAARKGKIGIKTQQKNGGVDIEVTDNGIGIKKENLVRVFDPFYTTKEVGEGTGLGLTVTSGIVQKHRGKITVASEENRGTTFIIQFPTL